jgi:hypothetical protein
LTENLEEQEIVLLSVAPMVDYAEDYEGKECWNPADSGTVSSPEPEWFRLRRGWMDDCG